MGRDEVLKQQQIAEGQRQFAAALASGDQRAMPKDRFGVAIAPGRLLLYRPPQDLIFKVVDVAPVLDPRMRPGLVTIKLLCEVPITVGVQGPIANAICIGTHEAPEPQEVDPVPEEPVSPLTLVE